MMHAAFDLYPYIPSQSLAFTFLGLFVITCRLRTVATIPYHSFPPSTPIIVDVICFSTQVAGPIMSVSEDVDEANNGKSIILAELALLIVAFGIFAICTAYFQICLKSASFRSQLRIELSWQRYIYGLYAVSVLFVTRNIARIVFQQGSDGEVLTNEAYLYVLDGSVMLAIVSVFPILHPGRSRWIARGLGKSGSLGEHILLAEIIMHVLMIEGSGPA